MNCNLVLDDDRPRYVGVVLRIVLRHPVDIPSTTTVVKAVLRSWDRSWMKNQESQLLSKTREGLGAGGAEGHSENSSDLLGAGLP